MNKTEIYKAIKQVQEKQGRKAISYITVLNNLRKGKTVEEIIEMKAGSGGKRNITGNKGKFKLSERDFERAKHMSKNGMNIEEITSYFGVSRSYFQTHNIF